MSMAHDFGAFAPGFGGIEAMSVLNSLGDAVVAIGREGDVRYLNHAAEQLLGAGASIVVGQPLTAFVTEDNPLFSIIDYSRKSGATVSESGIRISGPRLAGREVGVQAAPWLDDAGVIVLTLREDSIARQIDRQLSHRGAARSVSAMAAMLAHEVKNPLSGIRGAAQLLEDGLDDDSRQLTRLICEEADRIVSLVNRMEAFSDDRPPERAAVNIHEVLDRVRKLGQTGFARHVRFHDLYDPSIPPVYGNRDQLIQVFLNLVKNAAEAVPEEAGEIHLETRYRHGLRLAVPGVGERIELPIEITIRDNGPGIPDDVQPYLFDPFVTTKQSGSGLGLALVAKLVGDHGGIIDVESEPRRTVFRVLLPKVPEGGEGEQ